jgi:hypothetical protein
VVFPFICKEIVLKKSKKGNKQKTKKLENQEKKLEAKNIELSKENHR